MGTAQLDAGASIPRQARGLPAPTLTVYNGSFDHNLPDACLGFFLLL